VDFMGSGSYMEIIRYYLKLYIAIVLCLSAPAITDAAENANKPAIPAALSNA